MELNEKSQSILDLVHPDLARIVRRAAEITKVPFRVTEGLRSMTRQRQLVAKGKSWTLRSRHIHGFAVDLAAFPGGKLSWEWRYYAALRDAMMQAAEELGLALEWGGDWTKTKDGPHFQLPHKIYPDPRHAAYTPSRHDYRKGSRGEIIKKIQVIVAATPDGVYGSKTAAAVADWQRAHGMSPDGIVGPLTKQAMGL